MIMVQKKGGKGSNYDFTVRKDKVLHALNHKINNDPYQRGVQVDENAHKELPKIATNVSHLIKSVTLPKIDNDTEFAMLEEVLKIDDTLDGLQTTSVATKPPNPQREIDINRDWKNNPNVEEHNQNVDKMLSWSDIGSSPINEYNIMGLFDMAFPTLFPNSEVDWLQAQKRNVHLHEYAKHFL